MKETLRVAESVGTLTCDSDVGTNASTPERKLTRVRWCTPRLSPFRTKGLLWKNPFEGFGADCTLPIPVYKSVTAFPLPAN